MRKAPFVDPIYSRLLRRPDMQPLPKETAMEEERKLFEALWAGDARARDRIVKANTKFCAAVARQYENRGLPFDDLFNEAVIGLMRAVDRFDPNEGYKFISYAVWWIRQGVLKALADQGRTFAMPPRYFMLAKRLDESRIKLERELGRTPTDPEIAKEMRITVEEVAEIRNLTLGALSLDTELGPEEDITFGDLLVSPEEADQGVKEIMDRELIQGLLRACKPREREVLEVYFGLDGNGGEITLEELGDRMNLTRERIRQIKEKALKRIRRKVEARRIDCEV